MLLLSLLPFYLASLVLWLLAFYFATYDPFTTQIVFYIIFVCYSPRRLIWELMYSEVIVQTVAQRF